MRILGPLFLLCALVSGADSGKWVAPLAPRPVKPPRGDVHPIDAFAGEVKAACSDAVFARRAYLDLWGLLPTPEQLAAFEADHSADKRARLVDQLLAHRENYAGHWITFWNDLLRNDEGVIYHGERKTITAWLKKSLEENLPYDQFVAKLLNPAQPGDPEGFLTGVTWRGVVSASELPPMQAAQNSAQVFLGINLKCNSCHDSFISRWKLRDAYGLASFFSDGPLELVRCDVKQGKTAETKFLFPELGDVPQGMSLNERRAAAAKFFTMPENGRFTRTYVSRIWAQLVGAGLVANVDDMAAKPSNADLLDWLATDFAAHHYDTKYLLKSIMTSAAYQSRDAAPRRLSAEQFLDSVAELTGEWRVLEDRGSKSATFAREWRFKSSPLTRALGRPIRDQVTTVRLTQPTTLQALELVNGTTLDTLLTRGSRRMLGVLPPAPRSLFDSGSVSGKKQVAVDVDLGGRDEAWVLMKDMGSYDSTRVKGGLVVEDGSMREWPLDVPTLVKGVRRLQGKVGVDAASTTSDINGVVRFFVFAEKPDLERLVTAEGARPVETVAFEASKQDAMVERIWQFAFARKPSTAEVSVASRLLGQKATPESLQDLLWTVVMSPEFQYIR